MSIDELKAQCTELLSLKRSMEAALMQSYAESPSLPSFITEEDVLFMRSFYNAQKRNSDTEQKTLEAKLLAEIKGERVRLEALEGTLREIRGTADVLLGAIRIEQQHQRV